MTAPLRVLHVVEASFEGVGQHVIDLCTWQSAQGWTVDVAWSPDRATPRFISDLAASGCRHSHRLSGGASSARATPATLWQLRSVLQEHGPYDVVHGHSSWAGAWVRLLPGTRCVVYTPNALVTMSDKFDSRLSQLFGRIEQVLSRRTDLLIYVSETEQRHGRRLGLRPRAQRVVPNGIALVPLPKPSAARAELGLALDTDVIGFVGRLDHQKGVDLLIDAFAVAFGQDSNVELVLIGEGPLRAELEQQARESPGAERVRFLGRRPGLAAMPAFDVLAVPSRYEGFPYVVIEGLWAGPVMVVSDRASAGALIDDGVTGFLVKFEREAMAEALNEGLGMGLEDRRVMEAAARRRAERFSVSAMAERTAEAYRMAVARP